MIFLPFIIISLINSSANTKKLINKTWKYMILSSSVQGGGTLLHKLKDSGKKILVLERGCFLPREKANWNSKEVFQKE
jgi:hypothetical protein